MASRSETLYRKAKKRIPAGVNSPVRAFGAVGGNPVFIKKGKGAYLWDENGKKYLDFCSSWGPLLFGHAPEALVKELKRTVESGTSFGASTAREVELADLIHRFFPSMEKCRLVNSGTEAVMSAVRLARGYTGRKKILKLDGGYHGHVDSLLIKAGSGAATFGVPDSAGVPEELAKLTLSVPFNNIEALEKIFEKEGKNIAAFILEPVPANMGVIPPLPEYLAMARLLTEKYGSLLIFDEVITGFRLAPGGAQEFFGVKPDLTCLGKILGGGFPLAAYGGREKIMNKIAPLGPVYQAGTLSGNPVATAAAVWNLKQIKKPGTIKALNEKAEIFTTALRALAEEHESGVRINSVGSMFTIFFTKKEVVDYKSAKTSDTKRFARFFRTCLRDGLYLAPSQFEANFISVPQKTAELKSALAVLLKALQK